MKSHYTGISGSHGCLPDYFTCGTKEEVIARLKQVHDEPRGMVTSLRNSGYFEFQNPREQGAEYAEVSLYNDPNCCDEPEEHFNEKRDE